MRVRRHQNGLCAESGTEQRSAPGIWADYERVPDDPEEYGKQVLERIGADEELISTLDGFTDFEAMGNFYMREDGVRRTEFGLLRKLSDPFPEVQDGLQMH